MNTASLHVLCVLCVGGFIFRNQGPLQKVCRTLDNEEGLIRSGVLCVLSMLGHSTAENKPPA
jgi:hypothetical protein